MYTKCNNGIQFITVIKLDEGLQFAHVKSSCTLHLSDQMPFKQYCSIAISKALI